LDEALETHNSRRLFKLVVGGWLRVRGARLPT
jgi:hypothetical protein